MNPFKRIWEAGVSIGCLVATGVLNALAIAAGETDEDEPDPEYVPGPKSPKQEKKD